MSMGRERSPNNKSVFKIELVHHQRKSSVIRDCHLKRLEEDLVETAAGSKGKKDVQGRSEFAPVLDRNDRDETVDLFVVPVRIIFEGVDGFLDAFQEGS